MRRIHEEHLALVFTRLVKAWQHLLREKVELQLRITLAGNGRRLAILHPQFVQSSAGLALAQPDSGQFLNPCHRRFYVCHRSREERTAQAR